jgi:hypothetical protein
MKNNQLEVEQPPNAIADYPIYNSLQSVQVLERHTATLELFTPRCIIAADRRERARFARAPCNIFR